ncbi:hypothetical protein AAFF_G00256450 [Aldrovandia affinis]|uniref:Uncharacterized protein n=1 Tax=Aldrovandia affinis TaxID=143900 RepID=A0AAD7SUU3_9TELE|nr:hypothetical protein AAFF_G00256450 [Aldrovandia affinis]
MVPFKTHPEVSQGERGQIPTLQSLLDFRTDWTLRGRRAPGDSAVARARRCIEGLLRTQRYVICAQRLGESPSPFRSAGVSGPTVRGGPAPPRAVRVGAGSSGLNGISPLDGKHPSDTREKTLTVLVTGSLPRDNLRAR